MTIKNIYIADDGEEFETEEECLEYEEQLRCIDGVDMFTYTFEKCNQGGLEAFEHATYMFISDPDRAEKYFEYVQREGGYDTPGYFIPGDCLRYDERSDSWINMRDEIQELQDNLLKLMMQVDA